MTYEDARAQIWTLVELWVRENRLPWGVRGNSEKEHSVFVLVNR
jgi:hypothetical protein